MNNVNSIHSNTAATTVKTTLSGQESSIINNTVAISPTHLNRIASSYGTRGGPVTEDAGEQETVLYIVTRHDLNDIPSNSLHGCLIVYRSHLYHPPLVVHLLPIIGI